MDSRTLRSTVESGQRAGVDGHKRVRGSKVHAVVDAIGTLLALRVTPANEAKRRQLSAMAERVQEVTGETVKVIYADAPTAARSGGRCAGDSMRLVVVQRPEGRQGFVLLPKRWMVERSVAWVSRFRRLALKHRIDAICARYSFYGSRRVTAHHGAGAPRQQVTFPLGSQGCRNSSTKQHISTLCILGALD